MCTRAREEIVPFGRGQAPDRSEWIAVTDGSTNDLVNWDGNLLSLPLGPRWVQLLLGAAAGSGHEATSWHRASGLPFCIARGGGWAEVRVRCRQPRGNWYSRSESRRGTSGWPSWTGGHDAFSGALQGSRLRGLAGRPHLSRPRLHLCSGAGHHEEPRPIQDSDELRVQHVHAGLRSF